jgi:hypothetical protein
MSLLALIVRLPPGREYWYREDVPEVGETVAHACARYVVVSCEPEEADRFVLTPEEEDEVTGDPIAATPVA